MKVMRVVLMIFVVGFVASAIWLIVGLLSPSETPPSLSGTTAPTSGVSSASTPPVSGSSANVSGSGSVPTDSSSQATTGSTTGSASSVSSSPASSSSASNSQSSSSSASAGGYVNLTLVNKWNYLPESFEPDVEVIGDFSTYRFDSKAVQHLRDFHAAAKAAGYTLVVNSAYRSVAKQKELYENKVQYHVDNGMSREAAKEEALKRVLYPGSSEHNLGLAVDMLDSKWGRGLVPEFSTTKCYEWLRANCHKYGFILRYPDDKQDITGVDFEPWHYRYVGVEAATEIMQRGVCLEEYLGKVQS